MEAEIIKSDSRSITIQVTIPLKEEMLESEEAIQQGINQAGLLATQYALSRFDTDGSPIQVSNKKHTSKGSHTKTYQCPFGEFELCRHVYQSNEGGSAYCPLDNDARILVFSTPKFAKMVSQKYSQTGSIHVQRDLRENHGRIISRTYIQDISRAVGNIASSKSWKYTTGIDSSEVSSASISLDGTCMLLREDGWRQAMVGSISLYDRAGERIHTTYLAQAPEYGKETFYRDFSKEIETIKKTYPQTTYVGVADGTSDNWKFLQSFVDIQVLDFFHASEYLSKVSNAAFKRKFEGKEWLKQSCHTLKHEVDGAKNILVLRCFNETDGKWEQFWDKITKMGY